MKQTYITSGTCCRQIKLEVKEGIVTDVVFEGGCHGNTQGIAALVKGMKTEEVIARLDGIKCKDKPTSCPDQLAKALRELNN